MGCISSKSSSDEQLTNHTNKLRDANPANDEAMKLMAPKHDDKLITAVDVDVNGKEQGSSVWSPEESRLTVERCASFHTVEECDELLQKIDSKDDDNDYDAAAAAADDDDDDDDDDGQLHIDSVGKKDDHNEKGIEENAIGVLENIEFKTVASLRQWLDSPRGGGGGGGGGAVTINDNQTPKSAFGFYDDGNNTAQTSGENLVLVETSKQQDEENIIELVAVFDGYMKQLQIEEENILKQIHNTELAY